MLSIFLMLRERFFVQRLAANFQINHLIRRVNLEDLKVPRVTNINFLLTKSPVYT